jgi:hypothetical protein
MPSILYFPYSLLYISIFYILNKLQPEFVCDKIKNDKTFFIEKKLSIFKLIIFSLMLTGFSLILLIFLYYIYKIRET